MASQVLAFLRPHRRGTDWSQEEIAELYRIEHALLRARFSLETDRGVSDEGDPWFVFCRADGEVLVHITRSDDGYLLFGLGLPAPLTGRAIGDISKSFVNQIPLNIPVKQKDGPQLFVHPAATLAIIVGMIFLANDDVSLVATGNGSSSSSTDDQTAGLASGSDGGEPSAADGAEPAAADRTVKATVLAVLGKLADGTLLGGPRLEAGHQEGNYLSIVCTIAAVMMGASVALDDGIQALTLSVADTVADASAASTEAHQTAPDIVDSYMDARPDSSVVDPLSAEHSAVLSAIAHEDDAPLVRATVNVSAVTSPESQPKSTTDAIANLDLPKSAPAVDETMSGLARPIVETEAKLHTESGQHTEAAPARASLAPVVVATTVEAAPEATKQQASAPDVSAKPVTVHHEDAGVIAVEAPFRDLFKSLGLSDTVQIDRVVTHATLETLTLKIFAEPVVPLGPGASGVIVVSDAHVATPPAQDYASTQADGTRETMGGGGTRETDVEAVPADVAQGKTPLYDLAARTILFYFFQENPNAQAVFYDGNALVFDADNHFEAGPQVVKVWETDSGSTITLVGHAQDFAIHV